MKKKIYFIIAAIIQIIISIYSIISAKAINEQMIKSISMFPESIRERITNLYMHSGVTFIIVLSLICILIDVYIIYIAYKDRLAEKKGTIITLSVITLFTASYSINELIAIINVIVMASIKKEKNDLDKKKEIPKLEKEKVNTRDVILAFGLILFYFSQRIWGDFIPGGTLSIIIPILFYIVMIMLCILVFRKKYSSDFKIFKDNFKKYMNFILPKMAIFYLFFFVVSLVSIFLAKSTAENQNIVEQLPLFLSIPLAVIYAPIVEETLFRGTFRRFIPNDKVFILVSGIIFGLLHTIFSETTTFKVIILSFPYGFMGGFLAYIYVKTNNMMSNITCHALNNMVAMFFSILLTKL